MHGGGHDRILLGGHECPEGFPLDPVDVGGGILEFGRVGHGLVLMGTKAPVSGLLRLGLSIQDTIGHELEEAVEPLRIVHHVHHEVLDTPEVSQICREVG